MSLSVITAVVPSLSRFFSELQIGSGTRVPGTHLGTSDPSYGSVHELSNLAGRRKRYGNRSSSCRNRKSRQIESDCIRDAVSADRKLLQGWNSSEADDAAEVATQRSDHSRVELRP